MHSIPKFLSGSATTPGIFQILKNAVKILAPRSDAIFVHQPLVDTYYPTTSDLDLLIFGQVAELIPERLHLTTLPIDLIWLPTITLDDPAAFASDGVIPHRLLSSQVIYDPTGYPTRQAETVRKQMWQPEIQARRIAGFLELGFLTIREIGITWDFPAMVLFWLHIAYAACIASLCDAMGMLCPNVYTRPLGYIRHLRRETELNCEKPYMEALHLDTDPHQLIPPLRRMHEVISARFPEPDWHPNIRNSTRYEYRYFLARDELNWRISVAEEMVNRGSGVSGVSPEKSEIANAVYYLRFWAYSLARIPMVYRSSAEGIDVSFMRPRKAIKPELEALCPEILSDLTLILDGGRPTTIEEVKHALKEICEFRNQTLAFLKTKGMVLPDLRDWQPFQPIADSGQLPAS